VALDPGTLDALRRYVRCGDRDNRLNLDGFSHEGPSRLRHAAEEVTHVSYGVDLGSEQGPKAARSRRRRWLGTMTAVITLLTAVVSLVGVVATIWYGGKTEASPDTRPTTSAAVSSRPTAAPPREVTTPEPTEAATQPCAWIATGHGFIREDPDRRSIPFAQTDPKGKNLIGPCGGEVTNADGTWARVYCARAVDGIGWAVTYKLRYLGHVTTPPPTEYACPT
jgi:hypothetical protein